MQRFVISIDVGGTFTDCVVIGEDGRTAARRGPQHAGRQLPHRVLREHRGRGHNPRRRSRPGERSRDERRTAELGLDSTQAFQQAIRIPHGSTVATNIMVQGSPCRPAP